VLPTRSCQDCQNGRLDFCQNGSIVVSVLWFGIRQAIQELNARLDSLERALPEQIAGLENAADLYNRAAARAERSKPRNTAAPVSPGGHQLDEIRRRRGGF